MARWSKVAIKSALTLSRVIGDLTDQPRRKQGAELRVHCPFHNDENPSLRIDDEKDGGVWHCDPCGKGGDVITFVNEFNKCSFSEALKFLGERYGVELDSEPDPTPRRSPLPTGSWIYHRPDGSEAFKVERFKERDGKKRFLQSAPDGRGGWICRRGCMDGVERWLYRVDRLRGRDTVCLVEGEKVADAMRTLGITATTSPGGAGKWHMSDPTRSPIGLGSYAAQLIDRGNTNVAIFSDNDNAGRRHAEQGAQECHVAGLRVRMVDLPGLPPKGDVVDFLEAGGTKADLLKAIADAPMYEPATASSPDAPTERDTPASSQAADAVQRPSKGVDASIGGDAEPDTPQSATTSKRNPADVETLLAHCDLATIPTPPSAANMSSLEERLRRLQTGLESADQLQVAIVRGVLLLKFRAASVPSPAALIDSAFAPLRKTATDQNKRDLELFPNDDPWPDPVDGSVLLDDLREVIRQHVVLPPGAEIAIALWCIHTHLMECWDVSPFLLISSPVWRCGKSTLADFVAGFSHRGLTSSNASDAAVYRCIDKFAPTLILDEADSWLKMREELRGILNSGHKRSGAKVLRADGDTHEPRIFSTWAPKVVALIGRPPATIGDRSIDIPMRRRTKQEPVKRLRERKLRALCEPLRRQAARWAVDHREALSKAEPALPDALTDRAQDNWEPLIAIADEVGGSWPQAARGAALLLSNGAAQQESTGIDLLMDIKSIFDEESPADDHLLTKTILDRLCELEDRPWATWGRQNKAMTPQALAIQLKPFGPKPSNKRVGGAVRKGYDKADFLESWERYAPVDPNPGDQAATSLQVNKNGGEPENPVRYTPPDVADAQTEVSPPDTGEDGECSGVAARKPGPGEKPVVGTTSQEDLFAAVPATGRPGTPSISADEEVL